MLKRMNNSGSFLAVLLMISLLAAGQVFSQHSAVQSTGLEDYCQSAQQLIASTDLEVQNTSYSDREAFIKSKASLKPLATRQMIYYQQVAGQPFAKLISCKMKSADTIRYAYGEDSAGEEKTCKLLIDTMLKQTLAELSAEVLTFPEHKIIIDDDESVILGPSWLEPWPYSTAYVDPEANLHLRGKALYIKHHRWLPVPDRFLGNHYCHLPTPQYLKALLKGEMVPEPGV